MPVEVEAQELLRTQDCPAFGCVEELPCRYHPDVKHRYEGTRVTEPRLCRICLTRPVKIPSTPRGPYANLCVACIPVVGEEVAAKKKGITVDEYRMSKRAKTGKPVQEKAAAIPTPEMSMPNVPISENSSASGLASDTPTTARERLALRVGELILDLIDYAKEPR